MLVEAVELQENKRSAQLATKTQHSTLHAPHYTLSFVFKVNNTL